MTELRLISFLPSATEMVFALGLGDRLVGVSKDCDFPAAAKTKPVVVKPVLPLEKMSLCEMEAAVAERIGNGQNLYQVDERLLEQLAPTHILTQALCQVCAPSGNEITRALATLPVMRIEPGDRRSSRPEWLLVVGNLRHDPQMGPFRHQPCRHRSDLHHGCDAPRSKICHRLLDPVERVGLYAANLASLLHYERCVVIRSRMVRAWASRSIAGTKL
jgi:hypothetical protein